MSKRNTKITVKVPTTILHKFKQQLDGLHLKRDAFLVAMIEQELRHLRREMKGKVLSSEARRHIAGSLKRMGTTQVNIVAPKRVAIALNQLVDQHNLVRDAFVTRLIVFLRGEPALLKILDVPAEVGSRRFRSLMEDMPTSPLKALEAVNADPLYYLRVAIEESEGTGLCLAALPPSLDGLACYLENERVPGTKEYKAREAADEELFDLTPASKAHSRPRSGKGA